MAWEITESTPSFPGLAHANSTWWPLLLASLRAGDRETALAALRSGRIEVEGRELRTAPAHSPRLAEAIARELVRRLEEDAFPLRLPVLPLSPRPALLPLEA